MLAMNENNNNNNKNKKLEHHANLHPFLWPQRPSATLSLTCSTSALEERVCVCVSTSVSRAPAPFADADTCMHALPACMAHLSA